MSGEETPRKPGISPNGRLWMGEGTMEVPLELFAENRARLVEKLTPKNLGNAIVLLQGGDEIQKYDQSNYYLFQQESYFIWAFGVVEPGFYGAIEVETGKAILFIPRFDQSYAVWYGPIWSTDDFKEKYQVDEVYYVDELANILAEKSPSSLLTLRGRNSWSGSGTLEATFQGMENFVINGDVLHAEMRDLRAVKTDYELDVLRYAIQATCEGHRKTMRVSKPGTSEYQSESEFLHYCYSQRGCRHVGYTCICPTGENSAILHYGHAAAPNDRWIEDGDMCLYDMGAQYFGYTADVTTTFPANGKFTNDQKIIYNAVLKANLAARAMVKPGVRMSELSAASNRTLLENLQEAGLLTGSIDDMLAAGLPLTFQPHGLGHMLGLDVHDVGGNLPSFKKPEESQDPRLNAPFETGYVFTIEPGCYFIDFLLDEAMADPILGKFLVADVVDRFRGSGGVRIEDCIAVTDDGHENLSADLPRTVEEIEDFLGVDPTKKRTGNGLYIF